MKTSVSLPLLFSLLVALTLCLQNCKKEADPVKPGGTTGPGSNTSTTATTPAVSTVAPVASGIASTSGAVSATITDNGGAAITQHGFVYSKANQTPTLSDSKTEQGAASGPFPLTLTSNLTGLETNVTYYVRAYATNNKGTGYGTVGQFKTSSVTTTVTSYTTSSSGYYVTAVSIEISGYASFWEAAKVGEMGFCYSDSKPEPTVADNKVADAAPNPSPDAKSATFKSRLADLKPSTAYYLRPYATVDDVVSYGDVRKITTEATLSNATVVMKTSFPGTTISGQPITFILGDKFYVNARKGTADDSGFYEYNPATDTWTQKADIPITGNSYKGGANGISFTHGGKGYFGFSSGFSARKSLWEYDASTDQWKEVATNQTNPFGTYSTLTNDVYLDGKVYAIAYEKKLIEFDVESRKSVEKALPPGVEASANYLIVLNKTLYFYNVYKQTFAAYNGQTNTWTSKGKMPYTTQMITVGNQLYAFGSQVISQYDSATDTWKEILKLGSATYTSQEYNQLFGPQCVFSRSTNAFIGMRGSGVGKNWFEFNP